MRFEFMAAASAAFLLTACGGEEAATPAPESEAASAEEAPTDAPAAAPDAGEVLDAVLDHPRRGEGADRDAFRNPKETLLFFGFEPDMTVVEIWPGGGWYTRVLAPALKEGGGTYVAAAFDPSVESAFIERSLTAFDENFVQKPEEYGDIVVTALSANTEAVAPAGSADLVLSFRNVHNWMGGEFAEKAFADFYAALKPGGVLGVVEHRQKDGEQDPRARTGYVREDAVIAFAEAAGFVLEARSEVNANPKDTADHPFGVWTLPPVLRGPREGEEAPEGYDRETYLEIGESDRMTLKFRKPIDADAALLE
ncbi:MAG: hypothetical protein AAFR11_08620 [Pseudomonadota bacterium]